MNKRKIILPLLVILWIIICGGLYYSYANRQMETEKIQNEQKSESLTNKEFEYLSDFNNYDYDKITVTASATKVSPDDSLIFTITNVSDEPLMERAPFPRLEKKIDGNWYYAYQVLIILETSNEIVHELEPFNTLNGIVHEPGTEVTRTLYFTEQEIPGTYRAVFMFEDGGRACEFTLTN